MGSKDEEIAHLRQQVSGPTNGTSGTRDPEVSLGTNLPTASQSAPSDTSNEDPPPMRRGKAPQSPPFLGKMLRFT